MEDGLSLMSHYVDMQVSQREILRSGKSTNKCLDKELVIMGDTDRQKSLLGQGQVRVSLLLGSSQLDKKSCFHLVMCFLYTTEFKTMMLGVLIRL